MKEERVDYNTIRDDFSVYEIENGQILKVKQSLVDIVNQINENEKHGSIKSQLYSFVITPDDVERYDIEYEQGTATEKDQVKELKFKPIREIINIYETKKLFILVGVKVEKVFLTNKINKDNEPILRYQSVNGVDVMEKPPFDNPPEELVEGRPS